MSTVGQLIDRLRRDWLEPADAQPTRFTLGAAITTANGLSVTYDDTLLAPEELELLGPGTLIEVDTEEMIVGDIDETANTLTIAIRGANGTTGATHLIGAEVTVAPVWRRKVIFDALGDAVVGLYPDLYKMASTPLTLSTTTYTEVPAVVGEPHYFFGIFSGSTTYDRYPVTFLDHFTPSSTGKAIVGSDLPYGATGYLIYKSGFDRPPNETYDLIVTGGLDQQWEPILLVSAAAYLIAGREFEQIDQERLTQQLERTGFPVLSATRIREGLLEYRDQLLRKAVDALRFREPTLVQYTSGL
jgi:hypothetical protein